MTTLMLFILSKQKYYKKWFKIFRPYWNDAENSLNMHIFVENIISWSGRFYVGKYSRKKMKITGWKQ